jgi:hypothetical protein
VALVCLFAFGAIAAQTSSQVLIATSASGGDEFKKEFWECASRLYESLTREYGVPAERITLLIEDPSQAESLKKGAGAPAVAKATKAEFLEAVEAMRARVVGNSDLLIFLFGHATHDGSDYRFNLVGPDLTGTELGAALKRFSGTRVTLVAATPASGGLARTLHGRNRVIVTATKSEFEGNTTVFGRFLVEAFEKRAADTDKDGDVSVLEAFAFAQRKVDAWYKERGKLATEHALLEDDADGKGSALPSPANGEGLLAAIVSPGGSQAASTSHSPAAPQNDESARLVAERKRLEADIQGLRYRKSAVPEDKYRKDMEQLLLALARVDSRLRNLKKEQQ